MAEVNFTESFKPEKNYICSILEIAKNDCSYKSVEEISLDTGIPTGKSSGKVEPHIKYATFMGLINFDKKDGKYNLRLTELGDKVLSEDPNLNENLTLLLLHLMIVRKESGAPIWNKMFSEVFPKYKNELLTLDNAMEELNVFYNNKIKKPSFRPFVISYKSNQLFGNLNMLEISDEDFRFFYNKKISSDFIYLYMYAILCYWEESFQNRMEITYDEFKQLNFANNIMCDADTEYNILDSLAKENLISLQRQLTPFTIILNTDKNKMIELLYSKLI